MGRLRVMTYNIKGCKLDQAALVEVIRAAAPDVLGIQEPPRGPFGRRRLRRLAADCGLQVAVGGHGARTTALLVAPGVDVTAARAYRLPWHLGRTRRGYSVARVDGVLVVVVHLALASAERLDHVDRILGGPASAPGPRVVVGDVNEVPGGPTWLRLTRELRDAVDPPRPTFSALRPRRRLDAVLISPAVGVTGSSVPDDAATRRASDHLPIVVDLTT
ncbi:endonuclease/exonuclease/phosphatase family protein [Pengzhenrongella frigida]|uniref:Endonuclease n=1 Tax=Pengzhenrongella frigida TaxID=1259133 RepID=A0A4Q5N0E0_9MICO|nr:endonuclease/exonuclease/phosphatase family protein [Cellulomonas sp. HLT2-17]RYV51490.1 endonuclease [Cellulomonas sp. HLT2-17]